MIAANGVTARFLAAHGFPSLRRVLRSPERWERIVALAAALGDRLPPRPGCARARGVPRAARAAAPERFARSVAVGDQAARPRRVRARRPGGRPGSFRARGARLHALDRAEPALSRSRHAAHAQGRARRRAVPYPPTNCARWPRIARCKRKRRQGGAPGSKSAAALLLSHRIGDRFDAIVSGASANGTWVRIEHPAAEGKLDPRRAGLDVGDHVRVELVVTDVERGFVDFARAGH